MTGCSGAGKTSIAITLEDCCIKECGKRMYCLDGDNLHTRLNRDLSFSKANCAEKILQTQGVFAAVDVVSKEEVVGFGWEASVFKEAE